MIASKIIGTGKPLLIIHGFLGMSDNWKTFGSVLAEEGYEVHLLDMRNHGRSFHSDDFSYELMCEDIKEYCQEHSIEKPLMLGHSMGGKVVMLYAHLYPNEVEKIVVVDISPREYPPHHQDILFALQQVKFYKGISRKEIQETLSSHIPSKGVVQFLMKNVYRKNQEELGYRFYLKPFISDETIIGQPLPEDALISIPTLFVRGEKSEYILQNDELLISHHFKNATVETVANAGHWVHADNLEGLLKVVRAFL